MDVITGGNWNLGQFRGISERATKHGLASDVSSGCAAWSLSISGLKQSGSPQRSGSG